MSAPALAILSTGLVTPVGLDAPASCAAIRAKLSNPCDTRFIDDDGEYLIGHAVPLDAPWRGPALLTQMACMAIEECLAPLPRDTWAQVPLLLCLPEPQRPGRLAELGDQVFQGIQQQLALDFDARSGLIARGRVGLAVALLAARGLIHELGLPHVLVAGTDSLLDWPQLRHYLRTDRLLTPSNSNGFIPGEAAGAVLLGPVDPKATLHVTGLGFGMEPAHVMSDEPLRGNGLAQAVRMALAEAGTTMGEMDYRITDLSGEHYYFKEAALALALTLKTRKEAFDLWHPAECLGEAGAAAGLCMMAVADAAARKGYACGPNALLHLANDEGQRAALILQARH